MRKSRWTKEEKARATELRALKYSCRQIDDVLGKGHGTTYSMFWRETETPAEREQRLAYQRRRKYTHPMPGGGRDVPFVPPIEKAVPSEVLAERARALSQPLSLCAALMGDPPLTRSALGKRDLKAAEISLPTINALTNKEIAA